MMVKVIKMVTNPKTYLACSLKGLYRKADSFRKGIVVSILPMMVSLMLNISHTVINITSPYSSSSSE